LLKEVFVIDEGLLLFHYSKSGESVDSDQALLSSGLLSALRDFSQHARSNALESFYTENEFFLFSAIQTGDSVIACAFERGAPQKVANEAVGRIRDLVESVGMPTSGLQLEPERKDQLRKSIEEVVLRLFGVEDVEARVHQILDSRTDIPLAFVLDITQRKTIAKFARPRPLYREEQVQEFLLVHDTLLRVLGKIGPHEDYRSFVLDTKDYCIAACWSGRILSVTTGSMRTPENTVLDVADLLCHQPLYTTDRSTAGTHGAVSRSRLTKEGDVIHEDGRVLPPLTGILLSTLVNNLDSFIRLLTRKSFDRFEVVFSTAPEMRLVLQRSRTDETIVELLECRPVAA